MLVIASFSGCSCDDSGSGNSMLSGRVVDKSYNPIPGVSIVLSTSSTTTLSDGTFTLTGLATGTYLFSITCSGYIPETRVIQVTSGNTSVPLIVLAIVDNKSTDIDTGGGTAANTDSSVKVDFPSGSVPSKTSITITNVDLLAAPAPAPTGYKFIYLVNIRPEMTLTRSATLEIPLPSDASALASVPFFYYDSAVGSWKLLATGTVNSTTNKISVLIDKMGWIAAAILLTPDPGVVVGYVKNTAGTAIPYADVWISSNIVQTNSSGYYLLNNVPYGSVVINALKKGYNKNYTSVSVLSNKTVAASDILLSSNSQTAGSISGKITNAKTFVAIIGARVVVSGALSTYSDSNGIYTISDINAGSISASVFANGYKTQSNTATVVGRSTTTLDFSLTSASAESFYDDLESGTGKWTLSGLWNRSNRYMTTIGSLIHNTLFPTYVTLPNDDTNLPTPNSGTWMLWYGSEDTGSYIGTQSSSDFGKTNTGGTSNVSNSGSAITVPIDLTAFGVGTLSFWTWWEVESVNPSGGKDFMYIYITTNSGQTWNRLGVLNPRGDPDPISQKAYLPYTSGGFNKAGVWVKNSFDLTPYVGSVVQIKFDFDTNDEKYNGFRGWCIDDISVTPTSMLN